MILASQLSWAVLSAGWRSFGEMGKWEEGEPGWNLRGVRERQVSAENGQLSITARFCFGLEKKVELASLMRSKCWLHTQSTQAVSPKS